MATAATAATAAVQAALSTTLLWPSAVHGQHGQRTGDISRVLELWFQRQPWSHGTQEMLGVAGYSVSSVCTHHLHSWFMRSFAACEISIMDHMKVFDMSGPDLCIHVTCTFYGHLLSE